MVYIYKPRESHMSMQVKMIVFYLFPKHVEMIVTSPIILPHFAPSYSIASVINKRTNNVNNMYSTMI
jgi:hypothetical protein